MSFTDKNKLKEYQRQYYLRNKERIAVRDKARRDANKAQVKERHALWYQRNRDRLLVRQREYTQEHQKERQEYRRQYYLDHKEQSNQQSAAYYQRHKERLNAINQSYREHHKDHLKRRNQEWVAINRDRLLVQKKIWRKAHPESINEDQRKRRLAKKDVANKLTRYQWEAIKVAYGHRCAYCHHKMRRLTQDHVIPLIKGGSHIPNNVVPACRSCNSHKWANPPVILPPVRLML
jgi:uncharacterized protein with PIN domain